MAGVNARVSRGITAQTSKGAHRSASEVDRREPESKPWSCAKLESSPRDRPLADNAHYGSTEMTNDERERIHHTVGQLRQARGRVLKSNSDFLEIVQVIENFGRDRWKKRKLGDINNRLAELIENQKACDSSIEVTSLLHANPARTAAFQSGPRGRFDGLSVWRRQ